MEIRLLDPSKGNAPFVEELKEAACRVLEGGKYILGDAVERFEKNCADYLGVKYAIGISSGTDALIASLMAFNIGPGDEVICPSFTFFATAGAIARVGATPVFADINPTCFTIDPKSISKAITSRTRAIIPVHLFGQKADMEPISIMAKRHSLIVIEDACQAIGAGLGNGHTACFSFFPSKNLGGFGDGGLVTTQDKNIARKLLSLRNHGQTENQYHYKFIGGNFRLDALQAALLDIKLKYLPEIERRRRKHAQFYLANIKKNIITLPSIVREKHVFNQFTIRVPHQGRDRLKHYLKKWGIASAIYYPIPLHKQPCFQSADICLRETEKACREVLSLPIASELTNREIGYVVEKINNEQKLTS